MLILPSYIEQSRTESLLGCLHRLFDGRLHVQGEEWYCMDPFYLFYLIRDLNAVHENIVVIQQFVKNMALQFVQTMLYNSQKNIKNLKLQNQQFRRINKANNYNFTYFLFRLLCFELTALHVFQHCNEDRPRVSENISCLNCVVCSYMYTDVLEQ